MLNQKVNPVFFLGLAICSTALVVLTGDRAEAAAAVKAAGLEETTDKAGGEYALG
jgi:hypothetical protein